MKGGLRKEERVWGELVDGGAIQFTTLAKDQLLCF